MKKTETPYWVNWLVRDENNRLWGFPKEPKMIDGHWTQGSYEGYEHPTIIEEHDTTYDSIRENVPTKWAKDFGKRAFIPIVEPRDRMIFKEIPIYILLDTSMRVKEKVIVVFTGADLTQVLQVKDKYVERNAVDLLGFENMVRVERSSIYVEGEQ